MDKPIQSPVAAVGESRAGRGAAVPFAALRHPAFRPYFVSTTLAMMADNIEHVISYWVIFQKFQSPVLLGFAVISHWTPFLLFSVYFGAMADRHDCRRLIQTAQVMYIGVSLSWGVLFITDTIQVWHACVLLVVHGLAGVLWGPASQLLIHDIVGGEHLQSAVRLNATSRNLGVLFGPAVGGALMLALTPPIGLLANALIYLPLTIWLVRAPYTGHRDPRGARARPVNLREALKTAREASSDRAILSMVILAGVSALLVGNAFHAQMPEFAHDLGTDDEGFAYSVLLTANAAGAVVGGVLLEGKGWLAPNVRTAIVCAMLWCVALVGFAATSSYAVAVTLLFVAGILHLAYLSTAQTLVQLRAPGELRGRLVGLFNTSSQGLRAFSGVTVGVVGGLIGVHWSLGLSAMALLAVTIGLFAFSVGGRE